MTRIDDRIYTLIYCSRNRIHGGVDAIRRELQDILTACRRKNAANEITGALLYNAGSFAQILEGPLEKVQRTFEIIQRDPRHSEVTIIQAEFTNDRQFPNWTMAFADGSSFEGNPEASDAFEAVFGGVASAGEQMLHLVRDLMSDESDWLLLDTAATV